MLAFFICFLLYAVSTVMFLSFSRISQVIWSRFVNKDQINVEKRLDLNLLNI